MSAGGWILAAAVFNAAFGLFHLGFWKLFRWREELPRLSAINRGVVPVLNIMLTYVFFAVALAQATLREAWVATPLGRAALVGVTGFWVLRAGLQLICWPRVARSWALFGVFLVGVALHALALATGAQS
ncbi:MAG: hypothetical protein HZA32_03440 [Opitutae bacterium]|nr:hypothetical protein [Opitutae bacterium]